MKDLTIILIGIDYTLDFENVKVTSSTPEDLKETIINANSKYIAFINKDDKITKDYLIKLSEKSKEEFDSCYINYDYLIDSKTNNKILTNPRELNYDKPYYKDYIFSYIFKKEKIELLLDITDEELFNEIVDREFKNRTAIGDVIYYHDPNQPKVLDFIYSDVKNKFYNKNIIYVARGCEGVFNGYISWIDHLGKIFGNKYDITILYDGITEVTLSKFEKHFNCIKRNLENIYICDNLLVTYSTFYYPKNIVNLKENYLFIHGNMSDYENVIRYYDDIYTHYVAVSKIAAERAKGYFPTDNIEYVLNPYKLDEERVKPRLKLTSTLRYTQVKRPDRIEKMARLMTEMNIPYTWEVFTDQRENTNVDGLIFRERTANPMPYIKDSDYFVLLSDSESYSYSVVEALSVNTKVVVTPLPVYSEIGVVENDNATIIPFEYFEDGNEEKLKDIIEKLYKEKDKEINYTIDETMWDGYNQIFT